MLALASCHAASRACSKISARVGVRGRLLRCSSNSAAAPAQAPIEAAARTSGGPPPEYLSRVYQWAYLNPANVPFLDHHLVVNAILWGNADRLMDSAVAEFAPGMRVLQAAAVYGNFSERLARQLGEAGQLTVIDVANIQVQRTREKLAPYPWACVKQGDLSETALEPVEGVCCFFLLHEMPSEVQRRVVQNLLSAVAPGGHVVFVDYHRPHPLHPLRPIMSGVFRHLEPFAESLLDTSIRDLAGDAGDGFTWSHETSFGGLYQKVVARKR